ncbi:MAG TPA: ribosome-associated translation inhibitor RaiA [Terriglobales bacterium]|jgi:putative sigma-54 modulation protein|nr:ribosome-associated translation inhibitor RaiA [Terriglobales bacterium]
MNVEYTGRQYEVTPKVRKQVEHGLSKLTKILGDNFESKVILAVEKHRCKAEITVTVRSNPIVGAAEAGDMVAAVGEALDRIERQAIKHRTRWRSIKQKARKKQPASTAEVQGEGYRMAVGATASTAVPVVVHAFPVSTRALEAHVVPSTDSVAIRPMTVEEAVKEAQFRDRDVFVFRDLKGKVKVLHRTRDGKMELIEAP